MQFKKTQILALYTETRHSISAYTSNPQGKGGGSTKKMALFLLQHLIHHSMPLKGTVYSMLILEKGQTEELFISTDSTAATIFR